MNRSRALILVVDDEPPVTRLLGTMLEADGYSVVTAADGSEALAIFRLCADNANLPHALGPIDLVVCDLNLPKIGPAALYREMKQMGSVPKLLVCSGDARAARAPQLLSEGITEFLTKPFSISEILTTIHRILSGDTLDVGSPLIKARSEFSHSHS